MLKAMLSQSILLCSLAILSFDCAPANAQSLGQQSISQASSRKQFSFVLFYKANDAVTKAMLDSLQNTLAQRAEAVVVPVQVGNPAEQTLIDQYDASRIPLPTLMVLAPNGAICAAIPQKVSTEQIEASFVSPTQAACLKALQSEKLVMLCVQSQKDESVPLGVRQFQADSMFKDRTEIISVMANDAAEAKFLERLKVPQNSHSSLVAFMAPPGGVLGVFEANVTISQLAEKLAASGKCCDDESCKHNQAAAAKKARR